MNAQLRKVKTRPNPEAVRRVLCLAIMNESERSTGLYRTVTPRFADKTLVGSEPVEAVNQLPGSPSLSNIAGMQASISVSSGAFGVRFRSSPPEFWRPSRSLNCQAAASAPGY